MKALSIVHTENSCGWGGQEIRILTEARGFGQALSRSRRDSTSQPADMDWITGDTLTARWAPERDSTGAQRSRIRRIVARGSARAFTHLYGRDTTSGPSLNYSRGKSIDITLRQARIDRVTVAGRADGAQLEPRPPAPPDTTAKRDST